MKAGGGERERGGADGREGGRKGGREFCKGVRIW